jgi:hypothetical protein
MLEQVIGIGRRAAPEHQLGLDEAFKSRIEPRGQVVAIAAACGNRSCAR